MATRRQKWKDKLRPAKFRGVAFYVDTSAFETGRRGVLHEFPGRDIPYREDLGRKAKAYPLEGYILGSDYRAVKDRLIQACEKEGSGELIHPYYGKVNVCCESLTATESAGEGGFCKLSLKFVEAGSIAYPSALLDSGFLVGAAADLLGQNAIDAFTNTVSIVGQATEFVTGLNDKVSDFCDQMDSIANGVTASANDIANLAFAIRDIKANIRDLLSTPATLAAQMDNAYSLLKAAADPSDVFKAMKGLFTFGAQDAPINRTTGGRTQYAQNLEGVNTFIGTMALTRGAVSATEISYASVNDAMDAQTILTDQIDNLSLLNADSSDPNDETYNSLRDLRAQLVRAVPDPSQNLARVSEYTPLVSMPSLALVFDRYGSLDLEDDFLARNNIMNPGFIMGGRALEVLDRD